MNLAAWGGLDGLPVRPADDGGLINRTFLAGDPPRYVVQWVNPIFTPRVHEDIEAVTAWLEAKGLPTPRLVRTREGALYTTDAEGVWRVMTFVPGRTVHKVDRPAVAEAAGALVARFHAAVDDLAWEYRNVRPEAHDTRLHMERLAAVGGVGEAGALAERILDAWRAWEGSLEGAPRHCHGDLKISNLRFDEAGEGVCLLDLDTLAWLPLDVELGDALRSWCNPVGEDSRETRFDLDLFAAAMRGYQRHRPLSAEERAAVVPGVERIALELASRFCRDVTEDRYFGWNAARFPSRAAHNLHRAWGQYTLARDVRAHRAEAERRLAG